MNILDKAGQRFVCKSEVEMSLGDYLELCKKDKTAYATPAERLQAAIGEPELVDTRNNDRLSRIFSNEVIPVYKAFKDIYGLEKPIRKIVSFIVHAAQGLEERKQILYLKGPVGSSKSTIVKILKALMESQPFYTIKDSPVNDNPLSLFNTDNAQELGIPERYFGVIPSPWLMKRVHELKGDISKLKVVKRHPSEVNQVAISHVEPGDENNQDISCLVGKSNVRQIGEFDQCDADCYSFSGGLCKGNRALVEFAEMFKSSIKSLNPLLEATQSGFYNGTEAIGSIPFEGIIIAHSNESEWQKFRNDKKNEALIDRIAIVDIPYCLRYSEETKIYEKLLRESSLSEASCAPKTLEMLAQFSVMSRLAPTDHGAAEVKMAVYNGESLKHKNIDAKSVWEYERESREKGYDEGFNGQSTRFAFKTLSETFNYDREEVAANPLSLLFVLDEKIKQEHLDSGTEKFLTSIREHLSKEFLKFFDGEVKKAYVESYEDHGQNIFERYVSYADNYINDEDYRDPNTSMLMTPHELEKFLEEVEVAAEIGNKKDFRHEVVNFVLRFKAKNGGKFPKWTSYQKIRDVIEAKVFSSIEDMLPIISSSAPANSDDKRHHKNFVERMTKNGYTTRQVLVLVDWYTKSLKN